MQTKPVKIGESRALKIRLHQVPRLLPLLSITRTDTPPSERSNRTISDPNWLNGEAFPVRRGQRLHILPLGAVNHAVAEKFGSPDFGYVVVLLKFEEAVKFQSFEICVDEVQPIHHIPSWVCPQWWAIEGFAHSFVPHILGD